MVDLNMAPKKLKKGSSTRKFGDKNYTYCGRFHIKQDAVDLARNLRGSGQLSRITNNNTGYYRWLVWTRKKRGK